MRDGERVHVFYSEEDGGYIANAPDLRFCSAFGRNPEEALHEFSAALALYREAARETPRSRNLNPRVAHVALVASLILIFGTALFALLEIWQGF